MIELQENDIFKFFEASTCDHMLTGRLLTGDSLEILKTLMTNSVHAIVTDPPYGLSFMGKKWDYSVPSVELWKECLRVLKPGGHVLSFGGTRTYHRMVVAMEDAGFEIRDQVMWIYGSGFPKSHDVSKGIDKAAGADRAMIGINPSSCPNSKVVGNKGFDAGLGDGESAGVQSITAPATPEAQKWSGWGTALKPANEPICLARKPLSESTVAKNVLKHGVGGLNIDASRIGTGTLKPVRVSLGNLPSHGRYGDGLHGSRAVADTTQGRWPANVLFDEEAAAILGEPARFFYCAKASKSERNAGLEGETKEKQGARPNSADATGKFPDHDHRQSGGNNHPTVKPIKLMEYLIKLITPPGGTVLDPFMGSGSTGVAAKRLGFKFIGIELEKGYVEIALKRMIASGL